MTVRTYEKDGNITNCFRNVKEIKVMFITGRGNVGKTITSGCACFFHLQPSSLLFFSAHTIKDCATDVTSFNVSKIVSSFGFSSDVITPSDVISNKSSLTDVAFFRTASVFMVSLSSSPISI